MSDSGSLPQPNVLRFGHIQSELLECGDRSRLVQEKQEEIAEYIVSEYVRRGSQCLSLDVFDTLLLRNDDAEAVRFLRMADRIVGSFAKKVGKKKNKYPRAGGVEITDAVADGFVARELATEVSYRSRPARHGCREGCINDILFTQASIMGIESPQDLVPDLLKIEQGIEAACLLPNPAIVRACERVRNLGGRVIAVSDMYLGSEIIEELIDVVYGKKGVVDKVISSSDTIISKRSGLIFAEIESLFQFDAQKFLHVGDSFTSDVIMPSRAGWATIHFPIAKAEIRRREESLAELVLAFASLGINVTEFAKA